MGRLTPNIDNKIQLRKRCYPYLRSPTLPSNNNAPRCLYLTLDRLAQLPYSMYKLWHLPDHCDWMAPLPLQHRRWFCAIAIILLLVFFWPSSRPLDNDDNAPATHNTLTYSPPPQVPTTQYADMDWEQYYLSSEQTLTQLFQASQLNFNDVSAIEQINHRTPPSNPQIGQYIQIKHDIQRQVNKLKMEIIANK